MGPGSDAGCGTRAASPLALAWEHPVRRWLEASGDLPAECDQASLERRGLVVQFELPVVAMRQVVNPPKQHQLQSAAAAGKTANIVLVRRTLPAGVELTCPLVPPKARSGVVFEFQQVPGYRRR